MENKRDKRSPTAKVASQRQVNNEEEMGKRISISKCINLFIWLAILSIVGTSLPPTINFLNNFDGGAYYGHLASYGIVVLIFYSIFPKLDLYTSRKSIFKSIYIDHRNRNRRLLLNR